MRISLERAAIMLGTSEQMLRRWVAQGAIPSIETRGEYEFDLESLEAWAEKRSLPIKSDIVPRPSPGQDAVINLHDAMQLGGVHFGLIGDDVDGLLTSALDRIPFPSDIEQKNLLTQLIERERMASTGIGNGVAIGQ